MVERGSTRRHRAIRWAVAACIVAAVGLVPCPCAGSDAPALDPIEPAPGVTIGGLAMTSTLDPVERPGRSDGAAGAPVRPVDFRSGFWNRWFMPSLSHRFEDFEVGEPDNPLGLTGYGLRHRRDLSDRAQSDAQKAAESAVTDWFLHSTELEVKLDEWVEAKLDAWGDAIAARRARSRASIPAASAGAAPDATTVDRSGRSRWRPSVSLGLSRSLPKARLTWPLRGESRLRLGVRSYGVAEIEWIRDRRAQHRVWAGWDGTRGDVQLQYRAGF